MKFDSPYTGEKFITVNNLKLHCLEAGSEVKPEDGKGYASG